MGKKIYIIDDFYTNPDVIRELAINADYNSGAKYNYPGYHSSKMYANKDVLKNRFEEIIKKEIRVEPNLFGSFRIMTKHSSVKTNVHLDLKNWAALVFLTPNPNLDCGLGIFRHKDTNFSSKPDDWECRKLGYEDFQEFEGEVIHKDKSNLDKWEMLTYVEPKYNRLALIRGDLLFHAGINGFGENLEDSRITHNFFFDEKMCK